MPRLHVVFSLVLAAVPLALGRDNTPTATPELSRFASSVYLTSPSGDEFGMFPLPEDKESLVATRRALTKSHQLGIVYTREKADIIVVVSSRANRDVIRVFDRRTPTKCLWRLAAKDGLRGADPPLVKAFAVQLENGRHENQNHALGNIEGTSNCASGTQHSMKSPKEE